MCYPIAVLTIRPSLEQVHSNDLLSRIIDWDWGGFYPNSELNAYVRAVVVRQVYGRDFLVGVRQIFSYCDHT